MRRALRIGLALMAILASSAALAADWREATRTDARAIHAALLDSHPGVYDAENPQFKLLLESAFADAERRAGEVRSFEGYSAVLKAFIARFDDGHVAVGFADGPSMSTVRWPGFLTGYRDGGYKVMSRDPLANVPSMGAVLVSCDGMPAAEFANSQVGMFIGRWFLEASRTETAGAMFLDDRNPLRVLPASCVFQEQVIERRYSLRWNPLTAEAARRELAVTAPHSQEPIGQRAFGRHGLWVSLSTFDIYPPKSSYTELTALLGKMRSAAESLRSARPLVLDLRGNTGGSSHWSRRIADTIWSEAAVQSFDPGVTAIDWRTSAANIAHFAAVQQMLEKSEQPDRALIAEVAAVVAGMADARQRGEPLWRSINEARTLSPHSRGASKAAASLVYVLTDAMCSSACLDAVDLWKWLGAIQVGRQTSADTLYMDVRSVKLPSGYATLKLPTKVIRGRQRRANEPHTPTHRYAEDMNDMRALERWILALSASARSNANNDR